jgi:branched-subunit amino acid ABC-type transport system permease component
MIFVVLRVINFAHGNRFYGRCTIWFYGSSVLWTYGAEAAQLTQKTASHLRALQKQPQRVKKFFNHSKVAYAA